MLALGEPLDFLWSWELDLAPRALWAIVSDTTRMNRAMGLARMKFEEVAGGVVRGTSKNAGVVQEWLEIPWSWVAGRTLGNVRDYQRGFTRVGRGIYEIEPNGAGSRFSVYFGWIPRGPVARLLLKVAGPSMGRDFERAVAEIRRNPTTPFRPPPAELGPEGRRRLQELRPRLLERLAGREGALEAARRLLELVATGDDAELHRLRVRALARDLGVGASDLVAASLHATRLGLLNLSWDVICPHCRGVRASVDTLGDLPPRGRCDVCAIDFENDHEGAVEVTFHVHPSIREVPEVAYCSAEPAKKAHIEVQQRLEPGERRRVATTLPPGLYRRRLRGQMRYGLLEVRAGAPGELTWPSGAPAEPRVCAPDAVLVLENDGGEAETFVVEQAAWADDALRPVQLFTLQEFRDLFSRESLAAEVKLSVGEQTILFTDMIGSTRFYESRGDPAAFSEVRRHFTEVYEEVRVRRGAVVKTIGDAVMAAFHDPVDALEASRRIQARFPAGRADSEIRLRISLNTGPCIAVNLNSAIDYFGRTVNLASKLQALAEGGQIAFPRRLTDLPGVRGFLDTHGARLEDCELRHDALEAPVLAYRWTIS